MERKYYCGSVIKQIHDKLDKKANASLKARGLTLSQMNVLMELEDSGREKLSLKELEARLHVAQSTAAGLVARLERKGFVESCIDQTDHRVKNINITDYGHECFIKAITEINSAEDRMLSGMTEEEASLFYQLLKKAYKCL